MFFLVDPQHDDVNFVVDRDQFVGMIDASRPGHFADMDQPLNAILQLDERSVAHHVHHRPPDRGTWRVFGGGFFPGAGCLLLQSQSDFFFLVIDVQHFDFDFLVDGDHFRRVANPPPAHVGNVQQSVQAAQVDKGPKIGDVLNDAGPQLANFQFFQQFCLLFLPFVFNQGATADHDIPPCIVNF